MFKHLLKFGIWVIILRFILYLCVCASLSPLSFVCVYGGYHMYVFVIIGNKKISDPLELD